jgi:hypothetical protein
VKGWYFYRIISHFITFLSAICNFYTKIDQIRPFLAVFTPKLTKNRTFYPKIHQNSPKFTKIHQSWPFFNRFQPFLHRFQPFIGRFLYQICPFSITNLGKSTENTQKSTEIARLTTASVLKWSVKNTDPAIMATFNAVTASETLVT